MASAKQKRGGDIEKAVLDLLRRNDRPLTTREICSRVNVTWHPVIRHCELLESRGKIGKMTIGHSIIWFLRGRKL